MVLVDTSIWINHLREPVQGLVDLLEEGEVLIHPVVIGELACGLLSSRNSLLHYLDRLPRIVVATDQEVRQLIETHKLMGQGVGYLDMHLLASTVLSGEVQLWTRDKKLAILANKLSITH